jgi:Tol biopolymer transport system component
MSPEQVRAQRISHRSDIFSLGVILYEMLSGKRAFHGDSAIETLNAILKEDPPELSESHSQINPALERVVMHCLEKRPEQRFQSANDVAFALEALSGLSSSRILTEALPVTVGRRLKRERLAWVIFSGILLLSTVIFAVLYFTQGQSTGEHAVLASILPPEGSENLSSVALSPDGTRLAFIAEGRLWVRNINVGEDRSIEGTERAGFPLWSPDSSSIGFFTSDGKLKKVEVRGGPVQTLCDAPRGRGGTWNRDGVILFTPDTRDPIHKVSASGGTPEQVTHFDASHTYLTHRWPHFLPDGRHFLFFLRAAGADAAKVTGVYVGSLDSKDTKLLINNASNPVYSSPGYLLFVREGNLMAQPFDAKRLQVTGEPQAIAQGVAYNRNWDVADFSASQNGLLAYKPGAEVQSQLTWFDRSGNHVGTIGERGYYRSPAISPDGQRVAVDRFDPIKEEGDVLAA